MIPKQYIDKVIWMEKQLKCLIAELGSCSDGTSTLRDHNATLNKQGGSEELDEFYHLTEGEHEYLTNVVEDDTIGKILEAIAQPPTYLSPTSTLNNITSIREVGTEAELNITQTFTQNDGGDKISEEILRDNAVIATTPAYTDNLIVPEGNTLYQGRVYYGQGPCKLNNLGIEDCTGRINAGNTLTTLRIVQGIYPVFVVKSTEPIDATRMQAMIQAGETTKLVITSTGTVTVPYSPSAQYVAVAYPASSTTKTKWYVSPLSQGDIPGGVFSEAEVLPIDSPEAYWENIDYKIHVTPLLNNIGAINIELRNS